MDECERLSNAVLMRGRDVRRVTTDVADRMEGLGGPGRAVAEIERRRRPRPGTAPS